MRNITIFVLLPGRGVVTGGGVEGESRAAPLPCQPEMAGGRISRLFSLN